MEPDKPLRVISSAAPIRISDFGGWTDTWFAKHGRVLSIAVVPEAEVQIQVHPRGDRPLVEIHAENYGERYALDHIGGVYDRHPLLEAAIEFMGIPTTYALKISIFSEAPAGASTGTSASVSVAMIGALDCLTQGRLTPHEVARCAHRIETELLGQQCGVQDQLSSAFGGINFIEILDYPHAIVSPLRLPDNLLWELESRLSLVFLGQAHSSSQVHEKVIRELESEGPDSPRLQALRNTPVAARDALYGGDFQKLGQTMIANSHAQADLHTALVSPMHEAVIQTAQGFGVLGWKVNGAGGDGGSVTLLSSSDMSVKREMLRAIERAVPGAKCIPITLTSTGLRIWDSLPDGPAPANSG
jgi:D-glycero-alpha-D-manno-heptose-7-phosphate kinase